MHPSGRPIPPPKPGRTGPVSELRDSGISVTDEAPATTTKASTMLPSRGGPAPMPVGGVRQLACRFESIGLRYSVPTLTSETTHGLRKAPSIPQNSLQTPKKSSFKPVIAPKPDWRRKDIPPGQRAQALEERANAIAEQIYDTVCERYSTHTSSASLVNREHSGREGISLDQDEPCVDILNEELENPASTDGYSSFESSTDDEETPDESGTDHYYSHVPATTTDAASERRLSLDSNRSSDHIAKVIDELIEKERRYIETLDQGIKNYVPTMYSQTLPAALRGQRAIIFINVEEILRTHRDHLLPDLERAAGSLLTANGQGEARVVEDIARTFLEYIENDRFYCYVQYAMHHAESEALRLRYSDYFLKIQHDLNDRLGLNSLLLQPIQRLPRYKLLLNEMVKDLLKEADGKRTLNRRTALLCKVDKRLSNLIDRVNQAINIRDIRQCSGSSSTRSLSHTSDTPLTLILQPEGNRNPDRDTPINLLYQGKFLRLFLLDIYDVNVRRKYSAKLFAFEKLLIYVEILRDRMEYRGHYTNTELAYTVEGTNRIVLFAGSRATQEIIVQSETHMEMRPLVSFLQQMTRSAIYDSLHGKADHDMDVGTDEHKFDYEEDAEPFDDSDDQPEVWDEQRLTTSLIEAQEQFLEVLQANQSFYLDTLSGELKQKLTGFLKTFEVIKQLHKEILQDISQTPNAPNTVCRCFERYLLSDVFVPYFQYLREIRRAIKYVQLCQMPSNFHNRVASTVEKFTFLCIEHLQEFNRYFETLIVKYSDDSTLNLPIDTELFQRLAFVQVRLNAYRTDLVLNYNLFLLDERLPGCGLVFYNDRAVLSGPFHDTDAGPCRVFVCERAAVCVKLQDVPEQGKTVERFVRVLFLDRFAGRGMLMRARRSKRQRQRVNFLIDGTKYRIDFSDRQSQNKFFQNYVDKYTKM
ncbi:uncharacterized protein LOC131285548 [Anopheles ziemanni]|uniref:uncharacterized protein LOC131267097 n=1 Tax=Anopheles coustani TaxID=139045 RepID=UPI002657C242|nr:uncharacterized protein LOC131267097 [Anopheles coustani]XP_058170388.1 uncharacterized protein LOC131285548 [Anopheles ziemanni]